MALFTVHEAPDGRPENVVILKEGFASAAFIFGVLWAFWHRMWVVAAILLAITALISVSVSQSWLNGTFAGMIELAIGLVFGFEARRLRAMSLARAGYLETGLIEASSLKAAELKYFAGRGVAEATPQTVAYRPQPDDMLNLFGNV